MDALRKAILSRKPSAGLIVHSDRGSQYQSAVYRVMLDRHHMLGSMSRKGNYYDNARAESFFYTIKSEWIRFARYAAFGEAYDGIYYYIELLSTTAQGSIARSAFAPRSPGCAPRSEAGLASGFSQATSPSCVSGNAWSDQDGPFVLQLTKNPFYAYHCSSSDTRYFGA